ncbi:hypothetical protein GCM10020358_69290 [Amorphoplanes nipponensis]|uniref:DDE Tnp4 domain-containing protein n=1 Tax=Actinoplanes nipponensis TaxID=135950 RepID=A0A919MXE4_9ACTN|nr:hypothetical protein Ani05nite_67140 [Actinoplanes nipponensis]
MARSAAWQHFNLARCRNCSFIRLNVWTDRGSSRAGRIRALAYAILDGTLIPIDRVADQKPYYSGKHNRHGVNVQVIADAVGRLVWRSPALPGAVHDLTAARDSRDDRGVDIAFGRSGAMWRPIRVSVVREGIFAG